MQQAVELKIKLQYDKGHLLEEKQREQLKHVLGYLNEHPSYQYSYSRLYDDWKFTPCIVAKCPETTFHLMHMFVFEKGVETREYNVCDRPHCYNEVLGSGLEALLFDPYGEECQEMHERCAQHVDQSLSRAIRRNIETINETPDRSEMWEKIHVWRMRREWYSQRVWIAAESREMSSPDLYQVASPWLGPYDDKDLAIQAARDYEEE